MRAAILLLVAACGSRGGSHGSRSVIVNALAGERVEPGAAVIGHAPSGDMIDQTVTDAVGRAEVGVDDGGLISVVFPGTITTITPVVSVVTVPAPSEGELVIHGPAHDTPPLIVGVVQVDGPPLQGATYFTIELGCATVNVTNLPANIDVGACSMGSDTKLDVLVRGYHDVGGDPPSPVLDGYGAGRVAMIDGVAQLTIANWETTGTIVPITLDGVVPYLELTLVADGLPFPTPRIVDHAEVWTGFTADSSRVQATLAGSGSAQITSREAPGAPTAIQFAAGDFLPAVPLTTAIADDQPLTMIWDTADLAADAINLHATWQLSLTGVVPAEHRVVWDAVLPPDATSVTLPAVDGDLGKTLAPMGIVPTDVVLRYLDSSMLDGFIGLVAAGIYAEDTIQVSAIAPPGGELRVSHAIGLR